MIFGNYPEPKYMEHITDTDILQSMSKFKFRMVKSFDGTEIYTYEIGNENSEVLLFSNILRGLFPYSCKLLEMLSKQYKVITWESRGTPEYNFPNGEGGLSMESHALDMNEVANAYSIKDAHVVCWCSGSCVGVWAIVDAAFTVNSLVLLTPPIRTQDDDELSDFDKNIIRSHQKILDNDTRTIDWLRRIILKGLDHDRPNRPYWEPFDLPKLQYSTHEVALANLTVISNMLCENKKTVELLVNNCKKLPIMLIFSSNDEFIHYKNATSLVHELSEAKLIIYSNGGHGFVSSNLKRCAGEIMNYHDNL